MKKIDLTHGKVLSVLMILAIPIMGSSLLQFAYNIIDMIWVGALGSNAVASIGSSSFYIGLGYSINALVVIGTGIKVAHAVGRKNEIEVKQYINAGIVINITIGIIYSLALVLLGKDFIDFLNINNSVVEKDAYLYLALSAPMMFFAFFNLLYTRVFGSFGNNKTALKINTIGIIINIVLDPLFIYVFNMGVLGASIATLISNIIMFIIFISTSKQTLKFDCSIGIDLKKVLEIINLGFPMSFQRVLFTLVNIILAKIIAIFGSDAIAAQKIGVQIESITFMVIGGLNGAVASFVGQNFGAKKYYRISEGYKMALKIGIIYSMITGALFITVPELLVKIFVREENTIIIASQYLRIIAFSQLFSTVEMVSNGLFTGIGKPKVSATISIVFTSLRIPMALFFTKLIGLDGIWLSIALSSVLKGISAYLMYRLKYVLNES
ncbi:MATE family efflux transporter [Clostridium weizhouense]|uniref:Probable multidrug resistance protein NorM n=1 Tax=Clostridium weizhouense TaxID=2859781 RepID=A0ABS7AKF0_9CLOT|nr:MATE family efflux transporter [Clostridium weizhouense]MBW6409107.1 MATE family efflux transporter [Clostridium weizhouense]